MGTRDDQVQNFRLDMGEYHRTFYSRAPTISEDPVKDITGLLNVYCAATVLFKYQMSSKGMKKAFGIKTYEQIQSEREGIVAEVAAKGIQAVCLAYHVPEGFLRDTYNIPKEKKKSKKRKKKTSEKAIAAESNDETLSLEDRLPRRDQILEEMADKGIPQTASRYGTTVNQIILRRDIKQRHLAGVLGLPKINIPVGKVMRATGLSVRDYEGLFPHAFRV